MNIELLSQVCETPGAPGFEDRIRSLILSELDGLADEVKVDNLGNVIALKKGRDSSKTVMSAAHMDEIGFMVRHIDDKGFIRFVPLGGFDAKTLTAQRVIIHGKKDIIGVMGCKPIHIMSAAERGKMPEVTDYFIDTGLSKKELEKIVSVGDSVTRERALIQMGDCINVKSLDNRVSVFILLEALRTLKDKKLTPAYDFVAAFTVQEEVGIRGANVSALTVQPDFGIAIDITIASDTPGAAPHEYVTQLGEGTAIKLYDSSAICDLRMIKFLKQIADKKKIKWQTEILPAGGSDTAALQRMTPGGSITGALSIPTRFVHQPIEMCHRKDVQATIDLVVAAVCHMADYDWSYPGMPAAKAVKTAEGPADPKPEKTVKPAASKTAKPGKTGKTSPALPPLKKSGKK